MAAKKRGLGRGLEALLGGTATKPKAQLSDLASSKDELVTDSVASKALTSLPVDMITRGRFQPRRHFDEDKLRELADSIAAKGLVQPVAVRLVSKNKYELIAGERRWRAAQLIGLQEIAVVIHDVDDQAAMAMGVIENIQRDDLNPLETAQAYHRLLEEFELTHLEIGKVLGKSRSAVTNLLRLLDLVPEVKQLIDLGKLSMGHARALLVLTDNLQKQAADQVVAKGLSVRDTEALVKKLLTPANAKVKEMKQEDPDVKRLINSLTETLGANVQLKQSAKGKGQLVISYNSADELEGILGHIS